ncbi:MAG TPA: hypothetical protein VGJ60_35710 [Chloroflexota bacterium]|jgi:hypothetical protein
MTDSDYEFVEVKVSHKIDIKLSLDDLVNMVQQEAAALKGSPQLADKVDQLESLAQQLKGQLHHG